MVAFSLIPDASGNLIRHQRMNHLIVQYSRLNRPPGIVFQFILCKYLVVFHDVGRCPYLCRCASPGGYKNAYGHFQMFGQVAGKEVSSGTGLAHAFGSSHLPLRTAICLRGIGSLLWIMKDTHRRTSSLFHLLLAIHDSHISRPFHIRLSAAQPDFTQHHIRHFPAVVSAFHFKRIRSSSMPGRHYCLPASLIIDHRTYGITWIPFGENH